MSQFRTVAAINVDFWAYTAFLFVTTTFFFFDPEAYTPKIVIVAVSWIFLGIVIARRTFRFQPVFFLSIAYLLLIQVSKFSGVDRFDSILDLVYPWGLVNILFMLYFLSEDRKLALKVIDRYISIFVLLNIPSIFFFFALMLNLGLDYQLVTLGGREGTMYRNYYNLAIFGDYQILSYGGVTVARLAGLFEEAGMLGTYVSVLLATDLIAFPKRRLRKLALLTLGVLSLSLAFYVFLLLAALYAATRRNNGKQIVVMLCVITGATAFVPDAIQEPFVNLVVERFQTNDEGFLEGDSRYIEYSRRYSDYLASASSSELAVGHGARSNRLEKAANYASYQGIVYEGGFIGLFLVVSFTAYFLFWLPLRKRDYSTCILSIFPVLSLYQRPDFLSSYFIVIYAAIFFMSSARNESNAMLPRLPSRINAS